jgi:hypothetical protein
VRGQRAIAHPTVALCIITRRPVSLCIIARPAFTFCVIAGTLIAWVAWRIVTRCLVAITIVVSFSVFPALLRAWRTIRAARRTVCVSVSTIAIARPIRLAR